VTVYNKNVSGQCNLIAQIEQVHDKNLYIYIDVCFPVFIHDQWIW